MSLKTVLLACCAALLLSLVSACSLPESYRGNAPTSEEVEQLVLQQSDKDHVRQTLGSPTVINSFDQNKWYYISQVQRNHSLFASQNIQQTVLTLAFNDAGVLTDTQVHTLADAQNIKPSNKSTKIFGRNSNIIEDLFGTIGTFGAPRAN